jgi:hypothetical protein
MTAKICSTNRWETNCCGYIFNTKAEGIAHPDEPLIAKVHGRGYRIDKCPGCKKEQANVQLLTEK